MLKSGRGGSRPNSGRKPSPTGNRKNYGLRLSDTEYTIITQRAQAADVTVSEYIRHKALNNEEAVNMTKVEVIWDQWNEGWYCRLSKNGQEIDSLPPTVSGYFEDDSDEELHKLAHEAAEWEGINGKIEIEIIR